MSFLRLLALSFLVACGSDGTDTGECVDLCTDAQAGSCTSVQGSCSAFCNALDGVQDESGCTAERAAYQSCLADGADVCANDCDAEEDALTACVTDFCIDAPTNQDCQTLGNSF